MNEKPILFSGPMVQAILDGRKTQTRRVWRKPKRHAFNDVRPVRAAGRFELSSGGFCIGETIHCPYGKPGDTLWVRETWRTCREDDDLKPSELDPENAGDLWWEADGSSHRRLNAKPGKVRPSIYMPRWASRITLRVKGVRVERVQEITPGDCEAEGISGVSNGARTQTGCAPSNEYRNGDGLVYGTPREAFESLWDSINAKRGVSWSSNPWVWVVEFQKVE